MVRSPARSPESTRMPRTARLLLVGLLALVFLPAAVSRAEIDDAAWRDASKKAKRLMKSPGEMIGKRKTIRVFLW